MCAQHKMNKHFYKKYQYVIFFSMSLFGDSLCSFFVDRSDALWYMTIQVCIFTPEIDVQQMSNGPPEQDVSFEIVRYISGDGIRSFTHQFGERS